MYIPGELPMAHLRSNFLRASIYGKKISVLDRPILNAQQCMVAGIELSVCLDFFPQIVSLFLQAERNNCVSVFLGY